METARDLFVHELNDMLDAERNILEALDEQIEESSRPEIRKALEMHKAQTEKQTQRLEQCLEELDEQPEETECHGIRGIIQEHESFKQEDPSEELLEVFNLDAAQKVEHYEIVAYTGLLSLCKQLGLKSVEKLLTQSLKEEQQMLKKVEAFSKKIKPPQTGMEEEQEKQTRPRSRGRRAA